MSLKKILVLLISIILIFSMTACVKNPNNENDGKVVVENGYMRIDVGESNGRKTEGFGTQFDTCIVEAQNNISDADWQVQVNAIETMNLQNVRIRFYPEMYERGNDNGDYNVFDYNSTNVDFNSLEMQHLYRLLDVFEENGVKVDLSWYGCRATFKSEDGKVVGSWLGGTFGVNGVNGWMYAPYLTDHPNEEFAESVAACLNYLINTKGYTCVNEYSLFPEPEGVITDLNKYKTICNLVTQNLEKYEISDKVLFSGPADYGNNAANYDSKYLSFVEYEKATSSVYPFDNDSTNAEMLQFAQSYSSVCDKYGISWGIAECGTVNFKTAVSNYDTDTFDRALFMARFMINMVNGGCTNIKYFVFSDCNYDGNLNELGLFKFKHQDWKAKPVWYSWSLITRYTDIGSDIYPLTSENENICAVAFKLPDGSWSYMIANNSSSSKKVAVVNERSDAPNSLNKYEVRGSTLPENASLTLIEKSGKINTKAKVAHVNVPANSFVVLSNKA